MPITINGDGTVTGISAGGLPDGSISTADIADDAVTVTLAKLSTTGTPGAGNFLRGDNSWQEAGGGKLLQVVTTESVATGSTTSTSWASAGMTVTITPSATSSKVLLLCTTAMYNNSTDFAGLTIFRGLVSSGIQVSAISNTSTWGFQAMRNSTSQSYYNQGMAITVVDAPATTSAQLYTLAVKSGAGTQIGINYGAGNTSLTAMEIGA